MSGTAEFSFASPVIKFADGLLLASEVGGGDTSAIVDIDNVADCSSRLVKKSVNASTIIKISERCSKGRDTD